MPQGGGGGFQNDVFKEEGGVSIICIKEGLSIIIVTKGVSIM